MTASQESARHATALIDVKRCRDEVAARLAEHVEPDGSVRDRCRSRVLESALFLRLLQQTRLLPDVQSRIARYLAGAVPAHDLERIIQQAVISRRSQNAEAQAFLNGFRHPTGERKLALLTALMALTGAADDDTLNLPEAWNVLSYQGQAVWTSLTLCAIKIIHDRRHGSPVRADQRFLTELLRARPPSRVWQGNLLAHLVALHALALDDPLLHDGVTVLVEQLNSDGGLPFIDGQDVWVSALAGTALAESGIALGAARRIGDFIAGAQLADGGWGYDTVTTQSDVDDTSRCMDLLRSLDRPSQYAGVLHAGREYLVNIAGPDGGFPTYLRGQRSEADLTAGAALALVGTASAHGPILSRALGFLLAERHADGTFEPSWTRSQSSVISHVVQALDGLRRHGVGQTPQTRAETARAIGDSVTFLVRRQHIDGGWGPLVNQASDVISTAHAVCAVAGHAHPDILAHAADYLLRHHSRDGFTAPPDQVGPRPIPYDFPVLADIHALTALNRLCRTSGIAGVTA